MSIISALPSIFEWRTGFLTVVISCALHPDSWVRNDLPAWTIHCTVWFSSIPGLFAFQIQAVEFALGGDNIVSCASNIVKVIKKDKLYIFPVLINERKRWEGWTTCNWLSSYCTGVWAICWRSCEMVLSCDISQCHLAPIYSCFAGVGLNLSCMLAHIRAWDWWWNSWA